MARVGDGAILFATNTITIERDLITTFKLQQKNLFANLRYNDELLNEKIDSNTVATLFVLLLAVLTYILLIPLQKLKHDSEYRGRLVSTRSLTVAQQAITATILGQCWPRAALSDRHLPPFLFLWGALY